MHLLQDFIKNAADSGICVADSCFENLKCSIYCCDKQGKIIDCNEQEARVFGFGKPEDLFGLSAFDVAPEKIASSYLLNNSEVLKTQKAKIATEMLLLPNGREINTISYKIPLRTHSKKIIGIIGLSFAINFSWQKENTNSLPKNKLTPRQLECLHYLARGMTMKQIAKTLSLSPKTIEHHLNAIKIKWDCDSRHELIEKALGIFNPYSPNVAV